MSYQTTTQPHDPAQRSCPALLVIGDDIFINRKIGIPSVLSLGRLPECDIWIDAPKLSRRHALLHVETGPRFLIEDCGSSNGVFIAGEQIVPFRPTPLLPGQPVELGGLSLIVHTRWHHLQAAPASLSQPRTRLSAELEDSALAIFGEHLRGPHPLLDRISSSQLSVLILGETGSGKEVLAQQIHNRSRRRLRPFFPLNCAALPETILEAELFGYERGAFTGALKAKPGLLESADGGTLLLDEIGELPLATQAKLLRFLEKREVLRIGGLQPRVVDVRILSATHRKLSGPDAVNGFRQDLFFRLDGVTLWVPPLRERTDEILPLAQQFLAEASADSGAGPQPALSDESRKRLLGYHWPGNIRELRNVIQRALVLSGGGTILPEHLRLTADLGRRQVSHSEERQIAPTLKARSIKAEPAAAPGREREKEPVPDPSAPSGGADPIPLLERLGSVTRQAIQDALARCAGNQIAAARMLGIPRSTFVKRLEEFDIPRPRKKKSEPDSG